MAFSLSKLFSVGDNTSTESPLATVGIDVGSASVKVVEIEQTKQVLMLRTYGQLMLGPYDAKPLGETVVLPVEKRTEVVVDVMREAQVNAQNGALAMPLSSSFITVMPLTLSAGDDLESRVTVEAKKYVPLPLSDVTLDWTELDSSDETRTNVREIMLAAIENRSLSEYKGLLNTVGMTSQPAEIEAFSLIRSLWRRSDSALAIMDLGAKTSKLYLVSGGNLERIHRVAAGGRLITKRVMDATELAFEEAENLKRTYTRDDPRSHDVYKAMTTTLDGPLQEFKRVISQYESRKGTSVGRVAFAGGVTNSPYFIPYVQDLFGRDLEISNPFSKVAYPAFMEDTLKAIGPTFGVSLGAALRQFQT